MTASALVGDRERCLAAGMDDYVSKPVKLSELDRILSRWRPGDASGAGLEVVDGSQLDNLLSLDAGDGVFLTNLVRSFLTSSTESLAALHAAIDAGDADALVREAHRFKGEASTLGARRLAALCVQLERLPLPIDADVAAELVQRAEREMDSVRQFLQATLQAARVSWRPWGMEGPGCVAGGRSRAPVPGSQDRVR